MSSHIPAGNGHFTFSAHAAANACTHIGTTFCIDFSVCNFQLRGAIIRSSTNARTIITTIRLQRGACIFCGDGQFSGRVLIILFQARTKMSTSQGIVPLQLQGRVACASYLHRSIIIIAHIDIHIFERDRRILFGVVVDDRNDMLRRFAHSPCHRAGGVVLKGHDVIVVLCGLLDRLLRVRCLRLSFFRLRVVLFLGFPAVHVLGPDDELRAGLLRRLSRLGIHHRLLFFDLVRRPVRVGPRCFVWVLAALDDHVRVVFHSDVIFVFCFADTDIGVALFRNGHRNITVFDIIILCQCRRGCRRKRHTQGQGGCRRTLHIFP